MKPGKQKSSTNQKQNFRQAQAFFKQGQYQDCLAITRSLLQQKKQDLQLNKLHAATLLGLEQANEAPD